MNNRAKSYVEFWLFGTGDSRLGIANERMLQGIAGRHALLRVQSEALIEEVHKVCQELLVLVVETCAGSGHCEY